MKTLRSSEVARLAGVNVETLRFYERKGILPEPPRRESGYREFPADTVALIRFVKRAQELGFSLREIKGLLELRDLPRPSRADIRRVASDKITEIETKIRDLEAIRAALGRLVQACSGRGAIAGCPIVEALACDGACGEKSQSAASKTSRKGHERS